MQNSGSVSISSLSKEDLLDRAKKFFFSLGLDDGETQPLFQHPMKLFHVMLKDGCLAMDTEEN